jgi:hypothetical protein
VRLIYHPDAEAELIESARFYEQRVPSLGGQFLDAAELAIGAILEVGVRRYLMPRFPFAVYYRVWPDHLRILAFKHHSRDPDYLRYRLSLTPLTN